MKCISIILSILFSIFSCESQIQKELYKGANNNLVSLIKCYGDNIYIFGPRFTNEGDQKNNCTLLCIDKAFNKIWEKNFGNYDTGEQFEDFQFDMDGNVFIIGFNKDEKVGILVKCDKNGKIILKKRYDGFYAFRKIELVNGAMLIFGTKYLPNSSSDIVFECLKINMDGKILLETKIHDFYFPPVKKVLKVLNDKIILIGNGSDQNRKLLCMSVSGEIIWIKEINTLVMVDNKEGFVEELNVDIKNNYIYLFCKSNNRITDPGGKKVLTLDMNGNVINSIEISNNELYKSECSDKKKIFMRWDDGISKGNNYEVFLVKHDSKNLLFFDKSEFDYWPMDFIYIDNITYIIGNKGKYPNVSWIIERIKE